MQINLCEADRELFGVDEWLEFDVGAISINDLGELCDRFDFDPMDWPEPFLGAITLEQAGNPDAKPKPPRWQVHAVSWMVLRQAGCDVSWEQAGQVRFAKARTRPSPGKADSPDEPSTTPPSESSSD